MQGKTIQLFISTALRYPRRTYGALLGSATTVLSASFFGPLVVAQIIDLVQQGTATLGSTKWLILIYFLTQLYGDVIGWRMNLYLIWKMEIDSQKYLYEKIFTKLNTLPLSFHADRFGGSLVSQTNKLVGAFERFWDTIVFQLVPSVTSVIAAIIILSFIFWQYAIILGVISILFIGGVQYGTRFLRRRNVEEAQASTKITGFIADVVTNIPAVKSHAHETAEIRRLDGVTANWQEKSLAVMRGFLIVSTGYSSLMVTLSTLSIVAAVWASENNIISIATVYLAVTYTLTVNRQLWEFNNIMRNYNRVMGDANDMVEILEIENSIPDTSTSHLRVKNGDISFNDVVFSHDKNGKPLFDRLNLHVPAGQRIGLVGHSGAGKSSITTLLLRFKDVTSGEISIDGQNIRSITQASLRQAISYVPQEPLLFHRSLRDNIAYGKPDATTEEIREAARSANALDFIENLPEGFETLVGERGIKLSGGQRQRIAIARAMLKAAPILILDEATSALDSESEQLIQDALWKLMNGRTVIVIAHRLSTIQKLDRIIVLDKGSIAEEGDHKELIRKNGTYAKLWAHQSGGFLED